MIRVCSVSFSKNRELVAELHAHFPEAGLNDAGTILSGSKLIDYLGGVEAAIVGTEKINREIIDALPELKFIAKYGVGLDNLDSEYARAKGIGIGWQGGVNRRSVSELALGFMLGLSRNIFFSGLALKAGRWEKEGGFQLTGKTVGIVGCGFTGTDLARLLVPFGCRILICDILDKGDVVAELKASGLQCAQADLSVLLGECDLISLHVPLTGQTSGMVNPDFLRSMKRSSFLINTSRGGVVEQEALKSALQSNQIAGAAIDVFAIEPPDDLELLSLPNLMVTPHIGGNAREAVLAMGRSAIQALRDFYKK
ncbi:MAG: phosphoglycerate dehydrogenase [Spirochaetales bacterium]|nr:phosphoglycerate dehydrogenase [Leptospiraceae bacterium]MCP5482097.1 phosphoglycerate dehydrogenase [Spirochaetales bacterium]MCP5484947.1 phosphoglycerate dehydrogenase [Spirochaetales bacterium]